MLRVKLPEPFVVVAPLPVEHLALTARLAIGFAEPSVAVPLSASAVEAGGAALSEEPPPQPEIVAEAASDGGEREATAEIWGHFHMVPVVGLRPLAPRRAGLVSPCSARRDVIGSAGAAHPPSGGDGTPHQSSSSAFAISTSSRSIASSGVQAAASS